LAIQWQCGVIQSVETQAHGHNAHNINQSVTQLCKPTFQANQPSQRLSIGYPMTVWRDPICRIFCFVDFCLEYGFFRVCLSVWFGFFFDSLFFIFSFFPVQSFRNMLRDFFLVNVFELREFRFLACKFAEVFVFLCFSDNILLALVHSRLSACLTSCNDLMIFFETQYLQCLFQMVVFDWLIFCDRTWMNSPSTSKFVVVSMRWHMYTNSWFHLLQNCVFCHLNKHFAIQLDCAPVASHENQVCHEIVNSCFFFFAPWLWVWAQIWHPSKNLLKSLNSKHSFTSLIPKVSSWATIFSPSVNFVKIEVQTCLYCMLVVQYQSPEF